MVETLHVNDLLKTHIISSFVTKFIAHYDIVDDYISTLCGEKLGMN